VTDLARVDVPADVAVQALQRPAVEHHRDHGSARRGGVGRAGSRCRRTDRGHDAVLLR
jgi:hypothetical protein